MSRRTYGQYSDHINSEEEQILPREWDLLASRLSQVEKHMALLERKYGKLEKKFNIHAQQITQINIEMTEQINALKQKSENSNIIELHDQFKIFRAQIRQEIQYKIQNYENNQLNPDKYYISQLLEDKTRHIFSQSKSYVDQAVFELKELLKKYVRDQHSLETKIKTIHKANLHTSPKRSLGGSSSLKKFTFQSENTKQVDSVEGKSFIQIRQTPNSESRQGNTSRVSFLKQKLQEFQKINKKYEVPQEPKVEKKDDLMVQKMKNYREYLEQTQSEIEPSHLNLGKEMTRNALYSKGNSRKTIYDRI